MPPIAFNETSSAPLSFGDTAIDYARVWQTAFKDIPTLVPTIRPILEVEWEKLQRETREIDPEGTANS